MATAEQSAESARRDYDAWFTATPDPWKEIARLEHGGDRTAASTVQAAVSHALPAQHRGMEQRLLSALAEPGLTEAGRMFVCRMLALIGSAACVPAVAPLLHDAVTADAARYALDPIDDPAVDAAYREALDKVGGAAKAGLIASIGFRGDGAARGKLEEIRRDGREPVAVRLAAERAIERLTAGERVSAG